MNLLEEVAKLLHVPDLGDDDVTVKRLAVISNVSENTARRALTKLVDDGKLIAVRKKDGRGNIVLAYEEKKE